MSASLERVLSVWYYDASSHHHTSYCDKSILFKDVTEASETVDYLNLIRKLSLGVYLRFGI